MYNIEQIKKDLKNILSEYRYEHSIIVAEEAKKLANHYHIDEDKAYISGLVHDIAKEFSSEENNKWIKQYDLSKEVISSEFSKVLHAEIGSLVVKNYYHLDEEISNAVRYHAIGHVPMTTLEKIVFIADKIGRKTTTPDIDKEKNLAYENLDKALIHYLIRQKKKLEANNRTFHPTSLQLLHSISNNS